jgi:SAM-dependent methyltransferase
MSVLRDSWSAFSKDVAKIYLDGFGSPSERSKLLTAVVLEDVFGKAPFRLADFGCGNAHLSAFFVKQGLSLRYDGYDFSSSLLDAARDRFSGSRLVNIMEADIEDPEFSGEPCDIVLFSHVLETLQSPQKALMAAKRLAPLIMIRFYEPPIGDFDVAEIRQLDVGGSETFPYLRRTISRGYYDFLLNSIGCTSVEVHQVGGDRDQVHLLRLADDALRR